MLSFVNTICFPILLQVISSVLHKVPFLSPECNAGRNFLKFHHLLPPLYNQMYGLSAYQTEKIAGIKR